MTLITRISKLFRADLHAVLDRIEEPAALLRQAIREMEDQLAADQRRHKLLIHERSLMITRESRLKHALTELEEELDVCFEAGQDDLSRALIKRKLETQRQSRQLTSTIAETAGKADRYKTRIDHNRLRLNGMRQKAELLVDEENTRCTSRGDARADPCPGHAVTNEDVEVAFLREKQRRMRS